MKRGKKKKGRKERLAIVFQSRQNSRRRSDNIKEINRSRERKTSFKGEKKSGETNDTTGGVRLPQAVPQKKRQEGVYCRKRKGLGILLQILEGRTRIRSWNDLRNRERKGV